jgi:hypothetical protein
MQHAKRSGEKKRELILEGFTSGVRRLLLYLQITIFTINNAMTTPTRIRGSRACNRCCSRKTRCDGQDPCSLCRQVNEECQYRTQKKRGPPKGCPPRGGTRKRVNNSEVKEETRGDIDTSELRSNASSSSFIPMLPPPLPPPPFQPFNHSTPQSDPRSGSSTSPTYMAHQHSNINYAHRDSMMDRSMRLPAPPSHSLPQSIIDSLLDIYLTFVHPHWPIIYVPVLRTLHDMESTEPLLFEAVLAVAAATFDQAADQGHRGASVSSFSSVKTSNDMIESVRWRISQDNFELRIGNIQALILVSIVDLGYGRSSKAYQFGGIACRMALDMGLHEADFERVPPSKIQEGLRVVWGCYILDKILSAVLQRPVMMRMEDFDVPFPDTMERDEFDLWLSGPARKFVTQDVYSEMEHVKVHCLSSFQAWANVMHILEQILRNVYSRRSKRDRKEGNNEDYEATLVELDIKLKRWRETLPLHLRWTDDHSGVGPHIQTLRAWYFACMLLLNRPRIPLLDDKERQGLSGLEICRGAATEICLILETYEKVFRVRKIPTSWVYLIFQAATIHSSFSASPSDHYVQLSLARQESARRLDQCIDWLTRIAQTWTSASHHVEILKSLEYTSALTRPPSPATVMKQAQYSISQSSTTEQQQQHETNVAWQAFWNDMPASSEDVNLWESFGIPFTQQ